MTATCLHSQSVWRAGAQSTLISHQALDLALGAFLNHLRRNNGHEALDVKFPIKKKTNQKIGGDKLFYFGFLLHCKGWKGQLRGLLCSSFTDDEYSSGEREGGISACLTRWWRQGGLKSCQSAGDSTARTGAGFDVSEVLELHHERGKVPPSSTELPATHPGCLADLPLGWA